MLFGKITQIYYFQFFFQQNHQFQININQNIMQSNESLQPLSLDPRAYRFFPTKKQQKTQFTKKGTRFFYFGQIEHDEYELKKMKQFEEYVVKHKVQINRQYFDDQRLLLFLQGHHYKPEQTIKSMEAHLQFRIDYLPPKFERAEKLLKSGFFYTVGRDFCFRPILVFNAKLIDFKDIQSGIIASVIVHEQVIQKMFIPGQVQSWVVIYDLGGMGITQMPMNAIKQVTAKMSLNYGGKLNKMFVVNAPGTIWFAWKAVSAFMDQVTVDKIKIAKSNTQKAMWEICDKSQVQEKYGGTQKDRTQFWPLRIPAGVFDQKRLVSDKQYEQMFKSGKLNRNKVDPKFKKD